MGGGRGWEPGELSFLLSSFTLALLSLQKPLQAPQEACPWVEGGGVRLEGAVGSEKTAGPGKGSHSIPSALSFRAGGSLWVSFGSDSFWVS